MLPFGVPQLLVAGTADVDVPPDMVEAYAAAAKEAEEATVSRRQAAIAQMDRQALVHAASKRKLQRFAVNGESSSDDIRLALRAQLRQDGPACDVRFLMLDGADHYDLTNAQHPSWSEIKAALLGMQP